MHSSGSIPEAATQLNSHIKSFIEFLTHLVEHTISNHGVLGSIPIGFNFEIALYSNL